ncbi:MAG TPA: hypothetical protein VI636_21105 [Candidatus Angelobacter sp.]
MDSNTDEQLEKLFKDEYTRLFFRQWNKAEGINEEIERLKRERSKLEALMKATYSMMPERDKEAFAETTQIFEKERLGLTAEIRSILQSNPKISFYAMEIRDLLVSKGFDFSAYASNPLSSIHSVLKRFKKSEVKVIEHIDGKTSYRWRGKVKEPPQPTTEPPKFDYKQALEEIQKQANANMRKS